MRVKWVDTEMLAGPRLPFVAAMYTMVVHKQRPLCHIKKNPNEFVHIALHV